MATQFQIEQMNCLCSSVINRDKITYILYPMNMHGPWIEDAAKKYDTTIIVLTGMDWQNVFSPWPAKGVPKGDPDFKGEAPEFLKTLREQVIPQVEKKLGIEESAERSLVGVSMSGLFTLWQWMECDTFSNIASLSGSFWYEGFVDWMKQQSIPHKSGLAYFLLGDREPLANVKEFRSVGVDTEEIVDLLRKAGIKTEYEIVPGNHFSDPIPRLNKAMTALSVKAQD